MTDPIISDISGGRDWWRQLPEPEARELARYAFIYRATRRLALCSYTELRDMVISAAETEARAEGKSLDAAQVRHYGKQSPETLQSIAKEQIERFALLADANAKDLRAVQQGLSDMLEGLPPSERMELMRAARSVLV